MNRSLVLAAFASMACLVVRVRWRRWQRWPASQPAPPPPPPPPPADTRPRPRIPIGSDRRGAIGELDSRELDGVDRRQRHLRLPRVPRWRCHRRSRRCKPPRIPIRASRRARLTATPSSPSMPRRLPTHRRCRPPRARRPSAAHAGANRRPARFPGPHAVCRAFAAARTARHDPLGRRAAGRPRRVVRGYAERLHHRQRARHQRPRGISQRAWLARPGVSSELSHRHARLCGVHPRSERRRHRAAYFRIHHGRRRRDVESGLGTDPVRDGAARRAQQWRSPAVWSGWLSLSRHR